MPAIASPLVLIVDDFADALDMSKSCLPDELVAAVDRLLAPTPPPS
jgi:hypothetical protein